MIKNRPKRPTFLLRTLLTMLNLKVDRIYLQQLEYEMSRTDYLVDYNVSEIGYCSNPNPPYTNIQLEKVSYLIISHFQEEDNSLFNDALKKRHNWFTYIMFTNLRKRTQNGYYELL